MHLHSTPKNIHFTNFSLLLQFSRLTSLRFFAQYVIIAEKGSGVMILRIAICDDEESALTLLRAFLQHYETEHNLTFTIDCFSSGDSFLASTALYDIIFMDIYLPGMNGAEIVRKLPAGHRQQVVFVTTSREYAVEAFELGAAHYLLKPLSQDAVAEAIDRCRNRLTTHPGKALAVKTSSGNVAVPMEHIMYIEVNNKVCIVHTTHNTLRTYTSLDGLYELLDANSFLRAQRSYIVNMDFIESFLFDRLIMKNGMEIMLSRNNRSELKKQYQRFLFDKARRHGM